MSATSSPTDTAAVAAQYVDPHQLPVADVFGYGLLAAGWEALLFGASRSGSATPAQLTVLALGLGGSLAALAWRLTPGESYAKHRARVVLAARLYLALSISVVSVVPPQITALLMCVLPCADFLWTALVRHGCVVANALLCV